MVYGIDLSIHKILKGGKNVKILGKCNNLLKKIVAVITSSRYVPKHEKKNIQKRVKGHIEKHRKNAKKHASMFNFYSNIIEAYNSDSLFRIEGYSSKGWKSKVFEVEEDESLFDFKQRINRFESRLRKGLCYRMVAAIQ